MEEFIQEPARLEDLEISLSSLILDGCGTVKGLRWRPRKIGSAEGTR